MNTKSRFITAIMAALFAASALFSGVASAAHCEHEAEPIDVWDYHDQ